MQAWEVRFVDEYNTLKDRTIKLDKMLYKWEHLDFEPKCSKSILLTQLNIMKAYLAILEERARIEEIEL